MVRMLRRVGVALGSLVAATLCVGLVGSLLMDAAGIAPSTGSFLIAPAVSVGLGWLGYRDILRRELRARA